MKGEKILTYTTVNKIFSSAFYILTWATGENIWQEGSSLNTILNSEHQIGSKGKCMKMTEKKEKTESFLQRSLGF